MKKVLVLGYFGYVTNQLDGQTVKTRTIYELLKSQSGFEVSCFDTQQLKSNKFLILKSFVRCIKSDILVYLPAQNNFTFLFPLYYIISKIFRFSIIYSVVGGWLAAYISDLPLHRYMLKHIEVILVESKVLMKELQELYKLNNVIWFPNFRIHDFTPIHVNSNNSLKIVFFARMIKEKGLDVIFRFVDYVVNNSLQGKFIIHFYGQWGDREYFENNANKFDFISYKGILQGNQIYEVLQSYDLLLLPTYYEGEGFPGSILDAYISGIPVVCSRWKYLPEFVEDGKTGYTYDLTDELKLYEYLLMLEQSPKLLADLKKNAQIASLQYSKEVAWKIISEYLN